MLKVYGIKNCDSVKKAMKWLKDNHIAYEFIDFKTTPPQPEQLSFWLSKTDPKTLMNKHSKTYRELSDAEKASTSESEMLALLQQYPLLVKRPVIETTDLSVLVGFNESLYLQHLSQYKS